MTLIIKKCNIHIYILLNFYWTYNIKQIIYDRVSKNLTNKQYELVILLASGITLKEIAVKLNKSYNDIRKRTLNLYKKFDVHNRLELVQFLIKTEIISTKNVTKKFRNRFIKKSIYVPETENIILLEYEEYIYLRKRGKGKTKKDIVAEMKLYSKYPLDIMDKNICYKLNCKNITQAVYILSYLVNTLKTNK